jgi:hypothetical protein
MNHSAHGVTTLISFLLCNYDWDTTYFSIMLTLMLSKIVSIVLSGEPYMAVSYAFLCSLLRQPVFSVDLVFLLPLLAFLILPIHNLPT